MDRVRVLVVGVVLALGASAGCGSDDPSSVPADCTPIEDGKVTLVGENLAWDLDCLVVDEGTTVDFTVDLRDRSVRHNLAVSGPSGRARTELEAGPRQQRLTYEATTAGYHQFVCDIHPTMEGDLFVVATGVAPG